MHSQQPFNPYAPTTPPGNGDQIGSLRERVAKIEGHLPHLAVGLQEMRDQQGRYWHRMRSIEDAGVAAIKQLPELIGQSLAPLTVRLEKLEARWWEPLRPYLWRVYLGLAILAFAFGWRKVTGEPVPLRVLIEALIKSFS